MALQNRGLGRGINALFAENTPDDEKDSLFLLINDIEPNRDQPRSIFDETSLSQLADSIAEHGILQPLLVRPMSDGSYQIVAGERRWRAAKMAGLSAVPVVIKELNDSEAAIFALIENLQREDLNPVEEAAGIKRLIDEFGLTQEQAAQKLSKSRPAIANALRLLNLPEPTLGLLIENKLSPGHARALLALPDEETIARLSADIAKRGLSVRETEKLIKSISKIHKPKKEPAPRDLFYKEVELALASVLGRKIKIIEKKSGGTIEIEFFDREDLASLVGSFDK